MQKEQEEELPKNVQLRDFDDFNMLRGQIFNGVKNSLTSAFPVNYGNVRLELHDVDYDELDDVPISQQKKMLLEDKYITKKLRGTIKLFDTTNDQLLEEKRLSLMRVPYLTGRGTFIHGGNEYFSILQSRLLPGVYTRKQENGALETQFNARPGTGVGFRVGFEPETAQYRLKISQANLHMYSLLKDLGTSDEELEQSWGKEILNANRNKYDSRVFDKAYERLVPTRMKKLDKTREDKISSVRKSLDNAQIHARVAHKNLPNMFDAKIASEWNARWEGKQAAEKLIEDIPFAPDLTPDEVIDSYVSEDDNIKSAADMRALLQARKHSIIAKEEYKKKTAIMVAAMARYPDEFVVDEDGHMSGVTHLSSGFRIHVPKDAIPNRVKRVFEDNDLEEENGLYEPKTASEVEFNPELQPDDLREEYNSLYGRIGPRMAGMKSWKNSWIPKDDIGWLSWYTQYANGKRTEDDDTQIKRWKSFKARQVPRFQKNPTARMAYSLRLWAVDPLKLIDDEEKRNQLAASMSRY